MKINITKEQYKELVKAVAIADGIVGVLGDMMPEVDYKKQSEKIRNLENYFLQYASDYGCGELAQYNEYEKGIILDDEFYENKILPIINDYEEYTTHDSLANELAWRDFRKDHSEAEIKEMAKKNSGYFGVELYDYEKKYWDEFEENKFERLEVKK